MQQYIQTVEAVQLTDENFEQVKEWLGESAIYKEDGRGPYFLVENRSVFTAAGIGMWIVKYMNGGFETYHPSDFWHRFTQPPSAPAVEEDTGKCPECGGLNGGHGNRFCSRMTLAYAQQEIINTEQKWIAVNAMSGCNYQRMRDRLKKLITFWIGKAAILKEENNKLRNKLYGKDQAATTSKLQHLRDWKESAMALFKQIDEYVDHHPEKKLGSSKVDFVIERAKKYDEVVVGTVKNRCTCYQPYDTEYHHRATIPNIQI
jgi:hypothetical protein